MDADRPPRRVWHSRVLSRPRVFLSRSAVPARAAVTPTPELSGSSLVQLCWLQGARRCSGTPASPAIGVVTSCLQGQEGKTSLSAGFLGLASFVQLQRRALGVLCSDPGRHAAESPRSRLPWPSSTPHTGVDRQSPTGTSGRDGAALEIPRPKCLH